jgi:hypothetical protein
MLLVQRNDKRDASKKEWKGRKQAIVIHRR